MSRLKEKYVAVTDKELNQVQVILYFRLKKSPMLSLPQSNLMKHLFECKRQVKRKLKKLILVSLRILLLKRKCSEYNGYCTSVNRSIRAIQFSLKH